MSEKKTEQNSNNDSDQDLDFDPTADMMVNDFDDEHTLEEEEALEEDNSNELNDLQREGEMPLEELLALYRNLPDVTTTNDEVENEDLAEPDNTEPDNTEPSQSESTSTSQLDNNDDKLTEQTMKFIEKIDSIPVSSNLSRLISTNEDALYDISDDEEEDDYTPDWRRNIQIGQDYQALIPDSVLLVNEPIGDSNIDSSTDVRGILLWSPKYLNEKDVEKYLKTYLNHHSVSSDRISSLTTKNRIDSSTNAIQRDDELALFVLLRNDYNIDSAVTCKNNLDAELIEMFTFIKPWTEEDCTAFEEGLRVHGKDFHQIQKRLPNKTVNELVHFYYLWKKTERHDTLASKFKFEKRKYSLNHHVTDLMDHFLDDNQPQQTSFNSTSSSLNSSLNNTINHSNKHNSSSLTLLPVTNHLLTTVTKNESLSLVTTSLDASSTNELTSSNNLEENSNSSSEGVTSKLIINEVIDVNSTDQSDDLLVSSSSTNKSLIKTPIKTASEECVSSFTTATTTTSNSSSEM